MKPPVVLVIIFFIQFLFCEAQPKLQAHAALGYTEHFSLGIGCTFSDKHTVALLVTLGDFELGVSRALDAGFSGISFQYKQNGPATKELVDLIRRKGLKIQVWTIEDAGDMDQALMLNPDFLQTDVL